ncbi:MAG: ABC transporter permease [Rhodothalassiaceae bacterium]
MRLDRLLGFARLRRGGRLTLALTILSLTLGLAVSFCALLIVWSEARTDRHWPDSDRLYRIATQIQSPGRAATIHTRSFGPLGPAMVAASPRVEAAGKLLIEWNNLVLEDKDLRISVRLHVVDPEFVRLFPLTVRQGDLSAFEDARSIILTQSMADRLFGAEDPIGQQILIDELLLTVAAVVADLRRSYLDAEVFVPLSAPVVRGQAAAQTDWTGLSVQTYVRAAPGTSAEDLAGIAAEVLARNRLADASASVEPVIDPVPSLYLQTGDYAAVHARNGNPQQLLIIGAIGAMVLIVACVNHINLATASGMRRAREIALRKVCGANRQNLIAQFLTEAALVVLAATLLAALLIDLALPLVRDFLGLGPQLADFADPVLLSLAAGLLVIVILAAGLYPAFYLSRFKPRSIFSQAHDRVWSLLSLRNLLVLAQFAVSIALIAAALIVQGQADYMTSKDLGFDKDDVLVLYGSRRGPAETISINRRMKTLLDGQTGVDGVAGVSALPSWDFRSQARLRKTGAAQDQMHLLGSLSVDLTFFDLFRIKPLAGRLFSDAYAADRTQWDLEARASSPLPVVLNEAAARIMGSDSPAQLVGQLVDIELAAGQQRPGEVVGVVPDFHIKPLHHAIQPMLFYPDPSVFNVIMVRLEPGAVDQGMAAVQTVWDRLFPDQERASEFLEEALRQVYDREQRQVLVIGVLAGLACIIATLGLYGLAAFAIERRRTEIAIRRVLGARGGAIVTLVSWQFSKPVLIANLIAWPIAFFVMRDWLSGFAYRIDLTPLPFLAAGAAALVLAWATVSAHALAAARTRPASVLRND